MRGGDTEEGKWAERPHPRTTENLPGEIGVWVLEWAREEKEVKLVGWSAWLWTVLVVLTWTSLWVAHWWALHFCFPVSFNRGAVPLI